MSAFKHSFKKNGMDLVVNTSIVFYFLAEDDIPLITNCPLDQTLSSDPGSDSTTVTWTPPTFTDETGILVPTSSHSPGDTFLIGATQIVYEATDVTNNTAECTFTIAVQGKYFSSIFLYASINVHTFGPNRSGCGFGLGGGGLVII